MTTKLNRRAILAGAAAVPALALPAMAMATANPGSDAISGLEPNFTAENLRRAFEELDPQTRALHIALVREHIEAENLKKDAKLIELHLKFEQAFAKHQSYYNGPFKEAHERYEKLLPKRPQFPKLPGKLAKQIPHVGGMRTLFVTAGDYAMLKKFAPKHPVITWHDEAMRKYDKEFATFRKAARKAEEQTHTIEMEEKSNVLYDKCLRAYDRLMATPAHTLTGIGIKIKASKTIELLDGENEQPWKSVVSDIRRLST